MSSTRTSHALATLAILVLCRAVTAGGPTTIAVDLVDGSHVVGTAEASSVVAQASYGKMDIALHRIVSVTVSNDHEAALFRLRNGDRVRGTLDGSPVKVKTRFGPLAVPIKHVKAIQVYRSTAAPPGFRKDLCLHLSFDKEQGLTVPDNSGCGNNGEAIRGTWTPDGRSGGGYILDGKDDYVKIAGESSFDFGSSPFTIALWVKVTKVTPARNKGKTQILLAKYDGRRGCQWRFELTDRGQFRLVTATQPERGWEQSRTSGNNTMNDGSWHHVAVRKFGREALFYVDGRPLVTPNDKRANTAGSIGRGDEPVRIGAYRNRDGKFDGFLGGTVDDVMVWKRALSENEIRWLAGKRK